MLVSWVGNIGSDVPWSFCFLVRVHGGSVQDVGGGDISPDGAAGGFVSTLGVLEDGAALFFSLSELPQAL